MKRNTLGLAALLMPFLGPCGGLSLLASGGCGTVKILGNGEFYFEYGTKIAFGHSTEKSDETQIASSSVDWENGPIAWLFDWLMTEEETNEE